LLICTGHGSLGNLPSLSYGSVYMKLWHGLCGLDNDPHPGVAIMSQNVTNHIKNQVKYRLICTIFYKI
jgi:regulator-associated protein of mTOR